MSDQALRDPLTNLANRVLFHDRLDHAIQLYHRDQRSVAVLSMDIDDFKLINDNLGQAAGDALLVQAAQRLLSCVRSGDTVARLGGDEFAVLIEDAGENAHLIVYQIMEAFERPFSADGEVIFMRPSAGLAVAGLNDPDLRAAELLKHADSGTGPRPNSSAVACKRSARTSLSGTTAPRAFRHPIFICRVADWLRYGCSAIYARPSAIVP